jgi:hypothetical protein
VIVRWLLDQDRWEYFSKLHLIVLALLLIATSSALQALFANPTRWLAVASLVLSATGSYQNRIADNFLRQQAHFWDETKFPHGPPSVWMRNVTMDDSPSWRARARRQLFQNPAFGNVIISIAAVLSAIALFT